MADYRDDPRWKEYGFGRSMFPTVASSEFTTISHEPRYADTLSPKDLAEITKGIDPDSKWDRWATEGVPFYPGTTTRDYDPRTDTTIIDPPTLTIPEVDTFKELSPEERAAAKRAETIEFDPLAGYDAYAHALEADKALGRDYWASFSGMSDPGKAHFYAPASGFGSYPTSLRGKGLEGEPLSSGRYIPAYYPEDYYKLPKETLEGMLASSSGLITDVRGEVMMSDPELVDYIALLKATGNEKGVDYIAPAVKSDYYKEILADMDFKTSPSFGGPPIPTVDERLDVPDVRTYTPAAGEVVSPSFLDSIISPAAAGSMTPGRMPAADEYTALEMLRKEEADKAVLGEYAERYGASPDKDFADYSKITTGRLFEDLGISPDLDTRGLEMYPETYTYPKASEAELMGRDADIRYGDWESIRPDMTPSLSSLTKEADYVLGGDPYYGRRPAMIGRTPPAPEEPGFFDTATDYAKEAWDSILGAIPEIGKLPTSTEDLKDVYYGEGYGRDRGARMLESMSDPYISPYPEDPFPRMADPTFYEGPEGYSSITGTFYPTYAEIVAAEAAASGATP